MIKLGSILWWKRSGPLAFCLAYLIRYLHPDPWIRENWPRWFWGWHLDLVIGNDGDWIVRDIRMGGEHHVNLSLLGTDYRVINWIKGEVTPDRIKAFEAYWPCVEYNSLGYIICGGNQILNRPYWQWLRELLFPKVTTDALYCWQDVSNFCDWMDEPFCASDEMAFMPQLLKKAVFDGQSIS